MSNKIVVVLIALVLLLLAGMGGGIFMLWNQLSTMNAAQGGGAGKAVAATPPEASGVIGPIFHLETFIVNLADKEGNRYLRVTMDLELGNKMLAEELEARLPQVRDKILMILPTKNFEEIHSAEGKTALRDELMAALNGLVTQGKIINIYFKEFVVQ
jgi:flagellar FliL protein